ncbi:flavin reductase family protein [Georgenia alba]|uniref:Flavin reductase family protein n=1 Tax=Georgenia alba TaxID=2233858 RepID=A0ABW2Q8Q1_9MICO
MSAALNEGLHTVGVDAPGHPQSVSARTFKELFRHHAAGVCVVTADPGDGPVGLTVTSLVTISATPPLLAFSLSAESSATPGLRRAGSVAVHLLAAGDRALAERFATSGIDRFAPPTAWSWLPTGEPLLEVEAWLRGRVVNRMDAGGAVVVAVEPVEASLPAPGRVPLVYHDRTWHGVDAVSRLA